MKRSSRARVLSALLTLAMVFSMLPAAWAAEEVSPGLDPLAEEAKLTISGESSVDVDSTVTLTVSSSEDSLNDIKWTISANGGSAQIDGADDAPSVTVRGVSAGSVTVSCSATVNDKLLSTTHPLTVNSSQTPVKVDGVTLNETSISLKKDETKLLTATVTPEGAVNKEVTWSSNHPEYAKVENGLVTAVAAGEATITVRTDDGGYEATCKVTVTEDPSGSLSISPKQLPLTVGGSETLAAAVLPSGQTVTWTSQNDSIASVDSNGKVTAKAPGSTTITAKITVGGKEYTDSCSVTVTQGNVPVTGVTVSPTSGTVAINGTLQLTANVQPSNATNKAVTWKSLNESIATVDQSGRVTGKAAGNATILVTTADGGRSATCAVTVTASTIPVTGVTVSPTSGTVNVGATLQLTATVAPSNATNKAVTWTSSNNNIATVDANGKVTGKAVGSATIQVTTTDGKKTANCTVTVTQGSVATITYSVAVDKTLTLNASDFYNVCTGVYGNGLDYVKFDKNSSKGTLYFNYTTSDGGAKISTSERYSYSNSASKPISKITFVPDGNSGDTATFTYTGWDSAGKTYNGTLQIRLTTPSGDISYETGKNEAITFNDSDFNSICKKITGSSLDYVTFGSVSSSKGTLYRDYGGKNEDKLSTSTKCYYNDSPYLSNVTFVPAKDYTGTFTISYSGRSNARDSFSGSVKITVRKSSSILSYTVAEGKTLTLDDSDFNDFCKDETGYNMDYVKITPPSSSKGTFYYRYGESRYEEKISSSDKYYRTSSPKLDDVTFVPEDDYNGTVSVSFTGLSTNGNSFSGTMKIRVGDADEGDITYTAAAGTAVTFNNDDFNDYCKDLTDYNLDYVRFTLPSDSKGTLYYQYDKSGEKKVTSSTSYYRSSSPRLYDVTFVPAKEYSGNVEISFTGRSTDGDSFSGTVVISYSAPKEASVIRYSTTSAPLTFSTADFINACAARGSGSLTSVKFELPSTAAGKLYYGYTNPTKYGGLVSPAISFPASTGSGSISSVTFVPKASYNGTVSVNYTGTDSKNNTFTGRVDITVTPSTQSKRFTDMGNHGWAAASVDFLYDGGITTGTSATTYGPALNITRGDFILMLYRAFNLSANTTDGFKDVPSDSYYAQAIAVAKALGIAQGSDDGRFNPTAPLTREDAMVFLYRTLNRTGRTITSASTSYLNRFSDGSSTSSYAQDSVAALAQAGIIQGDTNGRLNPKGSLTRAEMAVILHRVVTL